MNLDAAEHTRIQESGRYRFHCRMDKNTYNWYANHHLKMSRACRDALVAFAKGVRGGRINTEMRSRFLKRDDRADKVERIITITGYDKEWLLKMSFMLCISQAEILRMALDWCMGVMDSSGKEVVKGGDWEAWHHGVIQYRQTEVQFSLWSKDRVILFHFPTREEAEIAVKVSSCA